MLKSPDSTVRAYAQSEAVLNKKKNAQGDEDVECENTSRLFVAGPLSNAISVSGGCRIFLPR
jgi:hypothetical protein